MSEDQKQAFEAWLTANGYIYGNNFDTFYVVRQDDLRRVWQAATQSTNAAMREALVEARIKIESRAISWEENEQPTLAAEYYRVLDIIDAALANAGSAG